ncbi:hypothetical protein KI387_033064 [Taxus chinensis]|uniref:H/ACA ribonucleoprotein complex non-core subunit NAF1 n=1 Tax=Taxus chinensis TaxID=29808 RepID=A0AA38BTN7_TAXCH|nr:hypothetical protein KI387_033064 [Taxus chinensis]
MVGLQSAIREQRRDNKSVSSEVPELDPNLIGNPFTDKLDPFSSSLQEFEDLDFIDDWICEPDCFEMADIQATFDAEVEAAKEANERKQVCEEFSPISFNIEAEGSSPSEVDNVGAMFGEVRLDGHRGFLSENAFSEHPIAETGCRDGKTERQDEKTECSTENAEPPSIKEEEIPLETANNVTSYGEVFGGVSRASHLPRLMEEYGEHIRLVQRNGDTTERKVSEKSELCLNPYIAIDHLVANAECVTVKTEENCMETSHDVTTSGNDFIGILTDDSIFGSNEKNVGETGLVQDTGNITERNVLEKSGVCLEGYRDLEHLGADAQSPSGKCDETPMETSNNVTTSGNGVSELSITRPNEGHVGCTILVQGRGECTDNKVKEFRNTKLSRRDYSDVESGEIVSEDDGEECTNMMETDRKDFSGLVEPDEEKCTGIIESDNEDCIGMVEADSEYCSDSLFSSSGSDSSEEDEYNEGAKEGEIKAYRGRRRLEEESLDYDFGSSDEEVPKGPIRSKYELQVLPPVPPVNIVLKSHHQTQPAGVISSVLGTSIVVEGRECHAPLNEGTILWLTEKRVPLGFIDEVFGPVKNPFYLVRFNTANDVPDFVEEGIHVSYVPQFASYVLNDPNLYRKGYDASGDNDEEVSEEAEFSDDEKEAAYKREKLNSKRGAKSIQNVQERHNGRASKNPEFIDRRKNKFVGDRLQHNANHANGPKGRAQEVKFTSKKPFGNSLCNGPPVSLNQTTDCNRPWVPAFQRMSQPVQSRGGHQTTGINFIPKPSPHLGPQGGIVKQGAILPTQSGKSRQGPNLFSGTPSFQGRAYIKPNRDATGGVQPVQPSVIAGQPVYGGDYKANSSTADHSTPLHDRAQVSQLGQSHSMLIHDPGQTSQGQHHTGHLYDPMGQTTPGQPQFRPPCGPAQGFHPAAGINLGQLPGGPMSNGKQIGVNPMGFSQMPIHPAFLGQPAQSTSIQQAIAFMAWNAGQSNHVAGGSQLPPSNANQGAGNPLNFNQMHTCVGIPVLQQPGLYTNMGALPGHNVVPHPMPWGQQTILQASPSQQFQTHLPSQNSSVPFSQPNNISGNIQRPSHPS